MYNKLLSRTEDLAREEAARFRFQYGYGFDVVEPEDLAVEALTRLIERGDDLEAGVQADGSEIRNLGGYLRQTIRNVGYAMARARTKATSADFEDESEDNPWAWVMDSTDYATDLGNPEDEFLVKYDDTLDRARRALEVLIETLPDWRQKDVAALYYLQGREGKDIAEEMGVSPQVVRHLLSDIRKELGEKEANLRAWRVAIHPDSRKPRSDSAQGKPVLLRRVLSESL